MPNIPAKGAKGKGKTEAALTDRIKCLIEDEIKQQPYEFDGQM